MGQLRLIAQSQDFIPRELVQELTDCQAHVTIGTWRGRATLISEGLSNYRERMNRYMGASVDFACLPSAPHKPNLFMADMDSTIITTECIDEIADAMGIREQISKITESTMRGELDFEDSLRARTKLLRGAHIDNLDDIWRNRIAFQEGIHETVSMLKQQDVYCIIVSGGFTYFSEKVAHHVGFHEHRANILEIQNGHLTGEVEEPILGREAKAETLAELTASKVQDGWRVCIGDGANDLAMLAAADLGIAYKAKPLVEQEAPARICHTDHTSTLFFLGL